MYSLPYFKEQDAMAVKEFMKQHSFAMLIGTDQQMQPVATQVPFLLKEQDGVLYLRAHIMKGSDHHKAFLQNNQALVVFTGPHTYVSASWYTHQQQASTWNYMAVHAHGELQFLEEEALLKLLDELTSQFENNPASPSLYDKLPAAYVEKLSKAIVAFEIKITSIDHVFKLSQNKDRESYENIIRQLANGNADAQAIAAEMQKRKDQLFPS